MMFAGTPRTKYCTDPGNSDWMMSTEYSLSSQLRTGFTQHRTGTSYFFVNVTDFRVRNKRQEHKQQHKQNAKTQQTQQTQQTKYNDTTNTTNKM
jgi:hypothetical protein